MLATLETDIGQLNPVSASAVAGAVVSILAAGLRILPASDRRGVSDLTGYHLARIKRRVQECLRDPDLSVTRIAQDLKLSPGHIHRLFQNEPRPLAHYIWSERLQACRRDLVDPMSSGRSVSEIAFGWGFSDAAHFQPDVQGAVRNVAQGMAGEWDRSADPGLISVHGTSPQIVLAP